MTSGRRLLLVAAIVLLVVVGVALAVISAPVLVVVELVVIALVAGLIARHRPARRGAERSRRFLARGRSGLDRNTKGLPAPRWVMRWESLPPVSAVPFAREQLTRVLVDWGLTGAASEPTQLVVTELLTNAIEHGCAPIELTVSFPGECVRVELHDAAGEPPRRQSQQAWQLRGRGLQLVDALSSGWGWRSDSAGKTVWADVSLNWPT